MDYDAIVVGGRVAGSSLALLLARQGMRVLVVDRDRFPSDTLSTHFLSFLAVGLLAKLGVLADVEAAGFRRITRHRTWIEDCCFEAPAGPPGSFSLAPRRDALDGVLLAHAQRAGAEFRPGTVVEELVRDGARVAGVVLRDERGRGEVRAPVVVGADGRHSRVAEWVHAEKYHAIPALRAVYYGYFRGIAPEPETTMEVWFGRDRMGFLFPMRPGEDCLAVELEPEEAEAYRADPLPALEAALRELPGMRRRMVGAALEGKPMGTRGIENFFRKPYGPGWALTGDAGYLKDPSTGTGILDAISQSFLLAEALAAWRGGAGWEEAMARFQRERDERMMPGYALTLEHTRRRDPGPDRMAWIRAALAYPMAGRALMGAIPEVVSQVLSPEALARVSLGARAFAGATAGAAPQEARQS